MPVATCFIKSNAAVDLENIAGEWAAMVGVDKGDVCLTVVDHFYQLGQQYNALINLYLPSLWSPSKVKEIQLALLKIIAKYYVIPPDTIFIMTSIIESGHVVENGKVVSW